MAHTPGQIRPWRHLAAFVVLVAVLYGLVFLTGDRKPFPLLGIDLQGGTRVTLTARTETGAIPPHDQLEQARRIIETRVNGLGVSGAEVVLEGDHITITVPGDQGDDARLLGQTAQLRFREVISGPVPVNPPATPPAPAPTSPAPQPPVSQAPASTSVPAQPQPQGAAGPVAVDVAPVAHTRPLQPQPDPTPPAPPPEPTPAPSPSGVAQPEDPELAQAIAQARATRQSTDPAVQQQTLAEFTCPANDPLRGYDDPALPLIVCDRAGTEKYLLGPVILEGTAIEAAQAQLSQTAIGWEIALTFDSEGAATWGAYTASHIGRNVAFVLDGSVVSAPQIQSAIYGETRITGQFTQKEAQELAAILRYGSLPLSFESSEAQTVSATLGLASLQAGLIAGGIGLALVFLYCLIYYRALGLLLILSLLLSAVVVYAVLVLLGRWIGFTLDLAGVAGFILAIGVTADSFVIFFEALKDEVRNGRSFRSAVPRAWVRSRRTILSADTVSFLAAAVLYILAVGQVRGFAFTLGMSTILDLIVVFLVTHPLVAIASRIAPSASAAWTGLGAVARAGGDRGPAVAAKGA